MDLIFVLISIPLITSLVYLMEKWGWYKNVCPICAGVFLTWLGLYLGYLGGYHFDLTLISMMMGGSVVGLAFTLREKINPAYSGLLFKTLFILSGFTAVYGAIDQNWLIFGLGLLLMVGVYLSFRNTGNGSGHEAQIKEELEDCC